MSGLTDLNDAITYAAKVEASLEQISRELDSWDRVARPKQVRPPHTRLWILHTGRGWGKSRTAAEDVRRAIEAGAKELLCIGPTSTDVHDVQVPMLLRVLELCTRARSSTSAASMPRASLYAARPCTSARGNASIAAEDLASSTSGRMRSIAGSPKG